jgi:hypothetical protein
MISHFLRKLLTAYSLVIAVASAGYGAELSSEVRHKLEAYDDGLNVITVTWTQTWQSSHKPNELVRALQLPPTIVAERFVGREITVAHRGKLLYSMRKELFDAPEKSPIAGILPESAIITERAYDGIVMYGGSRQTTPGNSRLWPNLVKENADNRAKSDPNASYFDCDYFAAAGIFMPSRAAELGNTIARSEILQRLNAGYRLTSVSTMQTEVGELIRVALDAPANTDKVESAEKGVYIYDLDPRLDYAVRLHQRRAVDGALLTQTVLERFEQIGDKKLWLPKKCTTEHYTYESNESLRSTSPVISEIIEVQNINTERIPDDRFALSYNMPGTQVTDRTVAGAALTFQIPMPFIELDKSISKLPPEIQKPGAVAPGINGSVAVIPHSRFWKWFWLIAIDAIIVVSVGVLLICRAFRKKAPR